MDVVERNDVNPICPHCEQQLDVVCVNSKVKMPGFFGRDWGQVYFCPHCLKVLGFADYSSS
jgi:hypothetical protein